MQDDGRPLVAGRDFTWTDVYELRPVAMVSENLARELWGQPAAAIGKRIRADTPRDAWREVVGVVSDDARRRREPEGAGHRLLAAADGRISRGDAEIAVRARG